MSNTYESELRDSVLRTEHTGSTTRTAGAGLKRTDTVYLLPAEVSQEVRAEFLRLLVSAGTSGSSVRAQWRCFVLTIVGAAFPFIGEKFSGARQGTYNIVILTAPHIASLVSIAAVYRGWALIPTSDDAASIDAGVRIRQLLPALAMLPPPASHGISKGLSVCATIEILYGYVSLVLFLAGKTITPDNRTAITVKRPGAIQRKYGLGEVACLTGDQRLSDNAHSQIGYAYTAMNNARMTIFTDVAKFSGETGDFGVEVAAVTTRLMAYSGMQHVILIDRFLSATPEASQLPVLASSLVCYSASLRVLENVPSDVRPFYKIINGDTTRAFNRRDVEALMVVAITSEARTNPTLLNYNLPENADEILTTYNRAMAHLNASHAVLEV